MIGLEFLRRVRMHAKNKRVFQAFMQRPKYTVKLTYLFMYSTWKTAKFWQSRFQFTTICVRMLWLTQHLSSDHFIFRCLSFFLLSTIVNHHSNHHETTIWGSFPTTMSLRKSESFKRFVWCSRFETHKFVGISPWKLPTNATLDPNDEMACST